LPLRDGALILETIHASGGSAGACHAQMYIMGTVLRHGNEQQKRRYLPGIAAGSLRLQAFGVTEPTTGSDTTQLKTRAEKKGNDRYIINGQKVWTSRALQSDLMLLLARTTAPDKVNKRSEGLSVFLVDLREAKSNGVEIRKIDAMINHNTCEVFFDNLEVPAENLIGEEGKGFKYIVDSMNAERILIASESLGDGKYFIKRACDYAKERVVFGRPIGQNQGVQFPIARAHAELVAAELVVKKACALFEAERDCGAEANMGKMLAADAAWKAADACLQTYGGFGFAREYGIERKWRETRLYQTAPISTNMILAYIAQHVLGLPRSY
jgi:acyl-CoA dehydrogenase